jgi:hypothetical protein
LILFLAMLATYRLAFDLTRMDGPAHLYLHMRGYFIGRFGEGHWLTDGVTCPVCLSFWIAFVVALGVQWIDPAQPWILNWLGIAGGALVLIKVTT